MSWSKIAGSIHQSTYNRLRLCCIGILLLIAIGLSVAQQPVINSFEAAPNPVILGSGCNLSWTTTDATSVYIDQGIGVVPPNGSRVIKPDTTKSYSIVVISANNSTSKPIEVVVVLERPKINAFTAEPMEIRIGKSTNLSWNVTGATVGVSIDPIGDIPEIGNISVSPLGKASYILKATNESGTIERKLELGCINPTANLTVSPSRILYGDQATLEWNVTEANRVSIDNGIGNVALSGSKDVTPEKRTTYTLTASNPCGEEAYNNNTATVDVFHEIYNFASRGEDASWRSADGSLVFGYRTKEQSSGSVGQISDVMVRSAITELLLYTNPNHERNGFIEGVYDLRDLTIYGKKYTPNDLDHISGKFGLLAESDGWIDCGMVTFKVILKSEGVPDFVLVGPTTLNCKDAASSFDAFIPAEFYGKPISVVLRVDAGEYGLADHAAWKDVALLRG